MSTRRDFLATFAAAPAALAAASARAPMAVATTCYMTVRRPKDTYEFLEYCHSLGAGGIQSQLTSTAPDYLRKLRARAEELGMWIEVMAGLPKAEGDEAFARVLSASKEVGALCVRSACLGGRRYETFATLDDWNQFVKRSHKAIQLGVPMAEKAGIPWALENHKDWTVDEFVAVLKKYSSEHLGVCLDTGNNMSLLDDAMEVVERLAPYAVSTHIKDMGVEEYEDGFLLSEVPFGEGMLDIPKIVQVIRAARPKTKLTLEMITRDPLKIPCLTDRYWATFPDSNGRRLASAMRMVRTSRKPKPLPKLSVLPSQAQAQVEDDNVRLCLTYARQKLG